MEKAGVIGSGSFGTAIALLVSQNADVLVYTRSEKRAKEINEEGHLRGFKLNDRITATNDPAQVCEECNVIFPVIPSAHMAESMGGLAPFLRPTHIIIHATKGLDTRDLSIESIALTTRDIRTMSQVIEEETTAIRIGCLSGPNLAAEILEGQPTATVIASEFQEVIDLGKKYLSSKKFYVFGSADILGAELAGALKNIIALGAGLLTGKGLGMNMQGMLITRGLNEMIHLGQAMGAGYQSFLGTAGIGDLVATASSTKSRNFSFGKKLGQGATLAEVRESQEELAEGVRTLQIAKLLINHYNLQLPIISILYDVVFKERDLIDAIEKLMRFPFGSDVDFIH